VSVALAFAVRSTWARIAALSWGPLIALAVVATGNHFVFDVVAGVIVTLAGFGLGLAVHRPLGWITPARLGTAGAAAAVAGAALLAILGVVPLPDLGGALEDATGALGGWAYPVVAGLALLETGAFIGLLVPGETAVVVGGVVAAGGEVELVPLIVLVWLAAAVGDIVSFLLGRRLGRPLLERHGSRFRLGPQRLRQVERFYARHGGKAVLLGRFTGVVRAVSPFIAGASGLALRRFLLWSAAGSLVWATTFTLVGYGFSESFAESGQTAAALALAVALTAAVGLATVGLLRSRRRADVLEQPITGRVDRLVVIVNGRASGIEDPHGTARELAAVLAEHDVTADAVVTGSEEELWEKLRGAASRGRRVVLVGGDGTLHSAANAPVPRLPELALVPAGRANNIARALGIPTDRMGALAVAANMPARPLDALRVATPDRSLYALESVSAGFQAEARAAYDAENSADIRQGLRALVGALRRFRPHAAVVRLPDGEMRSQSTAQLFLSNLPYFGFGFHVAPGADPADGRFEAILMEARGRRRLLRLLVAARRGRHLGRRGVQRVRATRARLTESLPLVADALPLGNTTATVTVEPARLLLASPAPGAAA
jgi:membrane-associated protein